MRVVHTPGAPEAIGPYSQAIIADGWVFCSGQIPVDPASGQVIQGDAAAQAERVLANLGAVLAAAGSDLQQVVKTTVYLRDLEDFASVNAVYARAFGAHRPARATVQVARLPKDVAVEIDATARVTRPAHTASSA